MRGLVALVLLALAVVEAQRAAQRPTSASPLRAGQPRAPTSRRPRALVAGRPRRPVSGRPQRPRPGPSRRPSQQGRPRPRPVSRPQGYRPTAGSSVARWPTSGRQLPRWPTNGLGLGARPPRVARRTLSAGTRPSRATTRPSKVVTKPPKIHAKKGIGEGNYQRASSTISPALLPVGDESPAEEP